MRTDILMVSHRKDFEFATYALRAVKKYARGFGAVRVVVPRQDFDLFADMAIPLGAFVSGFDETPGKGMPHHMAVKLEADIWCPYADAILHLDSDCICWQEIRPEWLFVENRPILYRERFEDFKHYAARYSWKACVTAATGIDPEWETMVRHPSVHLAQTHGLTRHLIGKHTGMNWKEWWLAGRNEFPQDRAEFPTLGAVAMEHAASLYAWIDYSCSGKDYVYEKGRDFLKAFWTHGGVEPVRAELEAIVA